MKKSNIYNLVSKLSRNFAIFIEENIKFMEKCTLTLFAYSLQENLKKDCHEFERFTSFERENILKILILEKFIVTMG